MLGIWQIANRKRNKDSMYSQSRICLLVFIILFVIYRNDFMLENANALLPNSYDNNIFIHNLIIFNHKLVNLDCSIWVTYSVLNNGVVIIMQT